MEESLLNIEKRQEKESAENMNEIQFTEKILCFTMKTSKQKKRRKVENNGNNQVLCIPGG